MFATAITPSSINESSPPKINTNRLKKSNSTAPSNPHESTYQNTITDEKSNKQKATTASETSINYMNHDAKETLKRMLLQETNRTEYFRQREKEIPQANIAVIQEHITTKRHKSLESKEVETKRTRINDKCDVIRYTEGLWRQQEECIDKSSLNVIRPTKRKSRKNRHPKEDIGQARIRPEIIQESEENARRKAWELHAEINEITEKYEEAKKNFFLVGVNLGNYDYELQGENFKVEDYPRSIFIAEDPETGNQLYWQKRDILLDSGASYHLFNMEDLNPEERRTIRPLRKPVEIQTANGIITVEKCVDIHIAALGVQITANVLEDTSNVLSMGLLCSQLGYQCQWKPGKIPYLQKGSKKVYCEVINNVPYVGQGDVFIVKNQTIGGTTYHDIMPVLKSNDPNNENESNKGWETSETTIKLQTKIGQIMPTVLEEHEHIEEEEDENHNANPTYHPSTSDDDQSQGGVPDEEMIREKVNDSEETKVLNDEIRKELMVRKIGKAWKQYTHHKIKEKTLTKTNEGTMIEIATHLANATWPLEMEQLQDIKQERSTTGLAKIDHGTPRGQNANETYTMNTIRGEKPEQERTLDTITLIQEPREPSEDNNMELDTNKYHWSCGPWQGSFTTTIERKSEANEPIFYATRPSNIMQEEANKQDTDICMISRKQTKEEEEQNEASETIQLITAKTNPITYGGYITENPQVE